MCLRCQGQPAGRWQSSLGPRSGFRFSGMGSGNFTSPQGQLPAKPAQGPWVESRWLHGRSAACPPLLPHSMADKNGALKCTFSAPGHSTSLLQGLATLRAQGQLLDVVLTVNRETFHAHKVVLAACSDYFRCAGPRGGVGAPPVPEGPSQGCASSCIQPRMALRERG